MVGGLGVIVAASFAVLAIGEGSAHALQFGSSCNANSVMTYRVWMAGIGWGPWTCDGATAGSIGESRQIEAIQVKSLDPRWGVCYQVHAAGIGWMGLTAGAESCDGTLAGTQNQSRRIEAIKVRQTGPSDTSGPPRSVRYRAYAQGLAWVDIAYDWATSGTTGQSRRMEAMWISFGTPLPACPSGLNYALAGGEGAAIGFQHDYNQVNICTGGQYSYHCGGALCFVNLQNFSIFAGVMTFQDTAGGYYGLVIGDHDQILDLKRAPDATSSYIYAGFSTSGP
jgi:hypothetical protein